MYDKINTKKAVDSAVTYTCRSQLFREENYTKNQQITKSSHWMLRDKFSKAIFKIGYEVHTHQER